MKFQEHLSQHASENCKLMQTSKTEYLEYHKQQKLIFTVFLFIYVLTKMSLIKSVELTPCYLICPYMQQRIYSNYIKQNLKYHYSMLQVYFRECVPKCS